MENITLQSMVNEFSSKNSITEKESLQFEKFVNYSLLVNDYYDSFDLEDVGTGDCIGVDGVAISLNGVLLYSEIEAKASTNCQFDSTFHFIQSKTSPFLDLGDYLKFLQTIYMFFNGKEDVQPEELKEAYKIKTEIYSKASRFRLPPVLEINYVYTGKGVIEDRNFANQIDAQVQSIRDIQYLFAEVKSNLVGANTLVDRYKETLNRTTKNLVYQRHVALPKLSSATAAYLGVAKCIDYIEILKNREGEINKGVFYDNVRDYLGSSNTVNEDIETTIKSSSQRSLFSVLNNGVTVVAKKVIPSGDTFQISGFQVVNGCQTSHVLFNNKEFVTEDMYITVKLIETDDIDLSSSVIKATNSQSVVMKEAFATIKPYHKRLEDFFKSMSQNSHPIYYERRPHQFDDNEKITSSQIASAPLLIKSFVSVIIEEPHKVHFYYGQLLRDYNTDKTTLLFDDSHHPGLYYIAHLITSKASKFIGKLNLHNWSFHIALLIKKRLRINLNINDKLTDASVMKIVKVIDAGFNEAAKDAVSIIRSIKLEINDHMLPEKTASLLDVFSKMYLQSEPSLKITAQKPASPNAVPISKVAGKKEIKVLDDGLYLVKDFKMNIYNILFMYGSTNYSYPNVKKLPVLPASSEMHLDIKDGEILKIYK